ncbi:LytR/AlgR family response regulator transcription factor [Pseudemcibacter aquimaris]|uniref:LytR/AlgR family response regulator transcription factor n=1 Tax=Pseudemcibacter aquimaris TaxID=2857064 RepID=UPI0020139EEE|nr:LytTR family DNA-binding domain-containing protein [Pseudemcibacter aquimaris]MCC3862004.1 LytTR family DNA-binding domain-containing protein [Pseudemcibacter aquimaris]WDU58756.1 LytTR family DNA-binding domain-containing protein [Pseudemcibacter aquimaris]
MIRTLIIDDEILARENIILRLEKEDGFEIVGQADNGNDAVLLVDRLKPDLIFLDINMPGMNGLDAAKELSEYADVMIIFVTAYDDHAVEAFQVDALDYLLKPINDELFKETIERVKNRSVQISSAKNNKPSKSISYLKRLGIRDKNNIYMIDVEKIETVEVAGDYLCITAGGDTYIHRQPLSSLLDMLNPDKFIRLHRSHAVNENYLESFVDKDGYHVQMKNGKQLPVSRRYQKQVKDFLIEKLN